MKTMQNVLKEMLPVSKEPKLVDFIVVIGGCKAINPTPSNEVTCSICGGDQHYTFLEKGKRTWLCASGTCATNSRDNLKMPKKNIDPNSRAVPWVQFCEENNLGDKHYSVHFEGIDQSEGKTEYMKRFVKKPSGILLMQGLKGTGKTYASLALCEFYTRFGPSCRFITQKALFHEWMQNRETVANFAVKFKSPDLLVIDDFGTGEISPGFMSFFMDLIDFREGWSNKGTVITTNLSSEQMTSFCGEALSDRLATGQIFVFNEKSRRIKAVL